MSDILSTDCANVNQTIIDSLVENCNKILLDAASESDMFFTTKHKKLLLKKLKSLGLIEIVLLNVKNILRPEI